MKKKSSSLHPGGGVQWKKQFYQYIFIMIDKYTKKSPCDSTNCAGPDIHPIHSVWSLILRDDNHMLIILKFYNTQDLNNV